MPQLCDRILVDHSRYSGKTIMANTNFRFEFSVFDETGLEVAGGSTPTHAQALSEGERYLRQYLQDGFHALEVRRVEIMSTPAAVTNFSPAQTVLNAAYALPLKNGRPSIAAALEALADQVVPVEPYYENCDVVREEILGIAAELRSMENAQ